MIDSPRKGDRYEEKISTNSAGRKKMKKSVLVWALACLWLFIQGALFETAYAVPGQSISVKIETMEPFAYFCLPGKGPFTDMRDVIARLLQESKQQNAFPSGPLMAVYYNNPSEVSPEGLVWEAGFPVTPQALIQAPLELKEWKYTQVAVGLHKGSYETTGETIGKMLEWIEANGYVRSGPIAERYLDMDLDELKPSDLKTEIWIPVKSARER
jgi:effector-binding domain-containing protein